MKAEELALPLTGYSTQESGPYTLPGQHNGTGSYGEDTGDPALRV